MRYSIYDESGHFCTAIEAESPGAAVAGLLETVEKFEVVTHTTDVVYLWEEPRETTYSVVETGGNERVVDVSKIDPDAYEREDGGVDGLELNTPIGKRSAPSRDAAAVERMTAEELIASHRRVQEQTGLVDPTLVQACRDHLNITMAPGGDFELRGGDR